MEDDMRLPAGMTCADCRSFRGCVRFLGIKGDEVTCDWAPSRFRMDAIGVLGRLLEAGGATLTLHGKPVTVEQVRTLAETIALAKFAAIGAALQGIKPPESVDAVDPHAGSTGTPSTREGSSS
jgi:hypothetical protein